jgi:hypothetical protein
MSDFGYVLFQNSSLAMRAERVLLWDGLRVRLMPAPRRLSKECGLAVRCVWDQVDQVRAALARWGVEVAGIHHL